MIIQNICMPYYDKRWSFGNCGHLKALPNYPFLAHQLLTSALECLFRSGLDGWRLCASFTSSQLYPFAIPTNSIWVFLLFYILANFGIVILLFIKNWFLLLLKKKKNYRRQLISSTECLLHRFSFFCFVMNMPNTMNFPLKSPWVCYVIFSHFHYFLVIYNCLYCHES